MVKPRAILTTAMEKEEEEEEERRPGVRAGTRSLAMPGATRENPGMEKAEAGEDGVAGGGDEPQQRSPQEPRRPRMGNRNAYWI